jgi:aspartyl-tRNA(Asn)/glutamyl-tRNA(Gln) amidotransferase subunit A
MARTAEDCAILLQALAGYDARDPASLQYSASDYRSALTGDLKGLRIGVLRHYWEEDQSAPADACSAMEEALAVFRDLGASTEEARLRPLSDSFDVKLIIAETEIFTIHLKNLQTRIEDFGLDFLQRALPACLFSASDYVRATREHRRAATEMTRIFDHYDVLVTVGQGAAPLLNEHDPLAFWKQPSRFTPANVAAGPAAVLCNGYSDLGLPLGMEVIGRPFDDATVLRVSHAYQQATSWHQRVPVLVPDAPQSLLVPRVIPHEAPDTDARTRDLCDRMAEQAGLKLDDTHRFMIYRAAPYALEMASRLKSEHSFDDLPANLFQHPLFRSLSEREGR